jgi:hypothetical protein
MRPFSAISSLSTALDTSYQSIDLDGLNLAVGRHDAIQIGAKWIGLGEKREETSKMQIGSRLFSSLLYTLSVVEGRISDSDSPNPNL